MKRLWSKNTQIVVSVFGTAVLVAWVLSRVDLTLVRGMFDGSQWHWFAMAVLLVPVQIVVASIRWCDICNDLDLPMSRGEAVREFGLSALLNQVLPGGVVGDGVRVWRQRVQHGELGQPLRAAVVDRAIGQLAQVVVTLLGLLVWVFVHPQPPPLVAWLVALGMLMFMWSMWVWPWPGLQGLIRDAQQALMDGKRRMRHAILSLGLMGLFLMCFWCCAQALDLPLGIETLTAVPLLMLALILPVSVGGWGLREVSATAVLGTLGWTAEQSVALSAAYGLVNLAGMSPAALVLLRRPGGVA